MNAIAKDVFFEHYNFWFSHKIVKGKWSFMVKRCFWRARGELNPWPTG